MEDFKTPIKTFKDLDAWKIGRLIRNKVYEVIGKLPESEKYNLASQMRRAAISITANIAEGYGRFHYQENIQFLRISRGSVNEIWDHLITCLDQGYIEQDVFKEIEQNIEKEIQILDGLIRSLKQKRQDVNR